MAVPAMQPPETPVDLQVRQAQQRYLDRCAPGWRSWRAKWSGGTTQVIELGSGEPLFLLHGGLGEAFQWGPLLAPLSRRYRVIAADRPGHGLADPFDYRGVELLEHARRFLGEVLDAAGVQAAPIVAASMGGLWAFHFALAFPARVTRLALVGAPAGIARPLPLSLRLGTLPGFKQMVQGMMRRPTRDGVRNFWKQLLVAHPERLDDDFLDVSVASQLRNAPSWFTLLDCSIGFSGMKRELVMGSRWKELSVPTTLIWGEKDAWGAPRLGDAAAAMNPKVRVVRIPDAGHAVWFDEPRRTLEAIEAALS